MTTSLIRVTLIFLANTLAFAILVALTLRVGIFVCLLGFLFAGMAAALWTQRFVLVVGPASLVGVLAVGVVLWAQAAVDNHPIRVPMSEGFIEVVRWPGAAIAAGVAMLAGTISLLGWVAGNALLTRFQQQERH